MMLGDPQAVMARLAEIENDLAIKLNDYEDVAGRWFLVQRDIKKAWATSFLESEATTVAERRAVADLAAAEVEGAKLESEYVALKAAIEGLGTRANIGMSILKAQGRA
jgi:hypothetical protein